MAGNNPVLTMDELPFKIVKMLGLREGAVRLYPDVQLEMRQGARIILKPGGHIHADVLDLVNPVRADGRLRSRGRQARFDETGTE